jgi:hypothetical protein
MSGSRIRKTAAFCATLVLSFAVLSQAAGPREFISGIWDKRPKVSNSRLNPKRWIRRTPKEIDATGHVKLGALNSIRDTLHNDPFRSSNSVPLQQLVDAAAEPETDAPPHRKVIVRPAGRKQSAADQKFEAVVERQTREFGQPTKSAVEERPYSPEFEALVQQVIADRENIQSEKQDRNRDDSIRQALDFGSLDFDESALIADAPEPTMQINPGPMPGRTVIRLRQEYNQVRPNSRNVQPPQFANEWSRGGVGDLIESSRREMQTGISEPDPPTNFQTVGQSQRQDDGSHLQLLGKEPPLVLSPQLPRSGHRLSLNSQRQDSWRPVSNYRPMIITPRVTSNQAPKLSVPNNNQHRRMSYEESASSTADIVQQDAPQLKDHQPLMMLPNREAQYVNSDDHEEFVGIDAAGDSHENETKKESAPNSLPAVNWDDSAEVVAPVSASLPWLMIANIAVCTAAIISFFIVRTHKFVSIRSNEANATGEAD